MSEYRHQEVESRWRKYWQENQTYRTEDSSERPPFYVLDMFPYPSGAGLHVGHPLGYIGSDIVARFKRHKGYNVLHPMGYDSFGLPAEQYAIQTGQHPAITTEENIKRYREQLDQIGFSYDWSREVRTSDPDYYRWTQWIFCQLFNSWYDTNANRARPVSELVAHFEEKGNQSLYAHTSQDETFDAAQWKSMSETEKGQILLNYRLAYLSNTIVNWCEALGTVLANDEVKDGVSERGGHPVVQKKMRQWSLRISAYADRLLHGLNHIEWPEAIKEIQRNWIGKSKGALVKFSLDQTREFEVFTTRPDTIYGVSFMVLAPEHPLVEEITTPEQKTAITNYVEATSRKTERDRQAEVGTMSGVFTGAYATHPFTKEKIPVWIADYVLYGYGTGAIMAVPAGDERDHRFAKTFDLPIPPIFDGVDSHAAAYDGQEAALTNSHFLNGLNGTKAINKAIIEIENHKIGQSQTNFRLRDAVFGRQRYWGEPIPVYFENGLAKLVKEEHLPLNLPKVDKYLPTEDGEPPLARSSEWMYDPEKGVVANGEGYPLELTTMPGWAGSSWYFTRYCDPKNDQNFADEQKLRYWGNVDYYVGGAEHATGHLLYARFWTKVLFDLGHLPYEEPFQKMVNQGMIQGRSNFVYRVKNENTFVSQGLRKNYDTTALHVDINLVENDVLDIDAFKQWRPEFQDAQFILEDGEYRCGFEVEKMSKSKYNVQTPDDLVEQYGADTLRMYEMFLGPIEQHKPWDTKGISGVYNFLKKFWRLFHQGNDWQVSEEEPSKDALKSLHTAIKKVSEDTDKYSFNTAVSSFMICVNELTKLKANQRAILEPLTVLLAPYAPHICEEIWFKLGHHESITTQEYPVCDESLLIENTFAYPVSFNGKMRFKLELPLDMDKQDIEKEVLAAEQSGKYLDGKDPKKVIVVPGKIINVVV